MMLPPIYQTITDAPAAAAIAGDRIYRHDDAPQDVSRPYVTWGVSVAPENSLSDLPPIDRVSVTVNCWSIDDTQVEALAEAVRDAIEPFAHLVSVPIDNRDRANTKLYRIAMQFDWWLSRA